MTPLSHYLRTWDAISATRVHDFVANSHTVAHRLHTYYRRDADVINPPVDTDSFQRLPTADVEDFYLMAGELVATSGPNLPSRLAIEPGGSLWWSAAVRCSRNSEGLPVPL